ncbi:hypothetical protein AAFF_G00343110 [Aldrovandia affinis]|uniref:Integrase zinc-binding domain-containing protein n=1 Tax=Aldrovandia affinis TaxID=143900 RepID=A0AAD7WNV4_9TELE|nr:hypothetical protein AAFF_G00343110 [Aldrovandia affinis]
MTLHCTTAYHPQANDLCARFHRSMKTTVRASLKDDSWCNRLPWVLLGIRTAPKEDLQSSSAELGYGQPLSSPMPWSASLQHSTHLSRADAPSLCPPPQSGVPANLHPSRFAMPVFELGIIQQTVIAF